MPLSFISCATEPRVLSTWLSTPITTAAGRERPVNSPSVWGRTASKPSRLTCPTVMTPTASLSTAAMLNSFRHCSTGHAHELRVDLPGRPRQRTEPVSGGRSAHRPRGGLDQSFSGPVLRPRPGLAHSARLCLRSYALRTLVGRSPLHRRSDRRGSHQFLLAGLR